MEHLIDWKVEFTREINQAEKARSAGNEGMARVCARRAAGIVVGEYLQRKGLPEPGPGAYARLMHLKTLPGISPIVKDAINHLTIRVSPDHTLPIKTDLIAEARWLMHELLND